MKVVDEKGDVSRELFVFLRYNQIPKESTILSEKDETLYQEFKKKMKDFIDSFESGDKNPSPIMGALISMFGFNRHYCSVSGLPIIGKYFKIGAKIVSQEAYESYQIIQQMEKKKEKEKIEPKDKKSNQAKKSKE